MENKDFEKRFKTISYAFWNRDPKEYFVNYHEFHKFDPEKDYTKDIFEYDFGHGLHQYQWHLYCFNGENTEGNGENTEGNGENPEDETAEYYVVAKEVLSEEERLTLAPYCTCKYHAKWFFDPFRPSICRCCVGCLDVVDSSYHWQSIIDKAREKRNAKKYWSFWPF